MDALPGNTALLIIDVQQGFRDPFWGTDRNQPFAETNIARLLAAWRGSNAPVIFIQHASKNPASPLHPSHPGYAIQDAVAPQPDEPVLVKQVNSAFIGTDLEQRLRQAGVTDLVITGLTTNHCVSTTTRMAANLGFRVMLVSDATATFGRRGPDETWFSAETLHAIGLAELHEEFATVMTTEEVLDQLTLKTLGLGEAAGAATLQHLRWDELPSEWLTPLLQRSLIVGQRLMVSRLFLKKGAIVPLHSHYHEQVTMVLSGALRFHIDGGTRIVGAGEVLCIPPHMPHAAEAIEDTLDIDIFQPPREDWLDGTDLYLRGGKKES